MLVENNLIRLFIPKFLVLISVIFANIPLHVKGMNNFMPMLDLIVIYYFAVYRPLHLNNLTLVAAGVISDIITGLPLGLSALVNIVFFATVALQRKSIYKEKFSIVWLGFVAFCLFSTTLKWVCFSIIYRMLASYDQLSMQFLLSCAIYPYIHWLVSKADSYLGKQIHI